MTKVENFSEFINLTQKSLHYLLIHKLTAVHVE